jgi:hypothetical protein
MLRVRSAEELGTNPASENRITLAPEVGDVITEARSEMERLMQMGELQNDPLRHPIAALSVHLDALHKLFVDGTLTLASQIEAAKRPVSEEDIRRLTQAAASGASQHAMYLARAANWRTLLIALLAVVAFGLLCVGGTWLFARSSLTAAVAGIERQLTGPEAEQWLVLMQNNDLLASNKTCGSEDGRTACSIVLWTGPLPPPSLAPARR